MRKDWLALLSRLDARYSEIKQEQGWADLADLQKKAHTLLKEHPAVRLLYSRRYPHILVDEYQDTSCLQQEILQLLAGDGPEASSSLYMVGDAGQSIYRFRGAEAAGFERMRQAAVAEGTCVELTDNFRAHPALTACMREWSERLFAAGGDGGQTGEDVRSGPTGPDLDEPRIELLIPEADEGEDAWTAEAELIARRISEIPVAQRGGVAILLQARTHLDVYKRVLHKYRIPVEIYAETGYWARQEVLDLFHMLRVLEHPGDGIALLGYLKSPLAGLSDEQLWQLAQREGLVRGFWTVAAAEGEAVQKARRFVEHWRMRCRDMGLADWLYALLYEGQAAARLGLSDVEPVLKLVDEMERRHECSLSDLLMNWQEAANGPAGSAKRIGESPTGHCVQMMTIHAAKGLEFPIVFVPDLSHRVNARLNPVVLSDTQGLAAVCPPDGANGPLPSLVYEQVRLAEKAANHEEHKRLLYVAMTRAKEQLIFSSPTDRYSQKNALAECSNWLDWLPFLCPALRDDWADGRVVAGQGWSMRIRRRLAAPGKGASDEGAGDVLLASGLLPAAVDDADRLVTSVGLMPAAQVKANRDEDEPLRIPAYEVWSVSECVAKLDTSQRSYRYRQPGASLGESDGLEEHEWGQVLHHMLEHLRPIDTLDTLRDQRLPAALAAEGVAGVERDLTREEVWRRLGPEIIAYMQSPLHLECSQAASAYNELPFTYRLFEQQGRSLYISGIVDKLWLRPDGGATLIDVKTHRIPNRAKRQRLIRTYTPQLQLYAYVAERLLGWRVDRVGLYLTAEQSFVEVPCGGAGTRSLLQRLEQLWLGGGPEEKLKRA